MRTRRGFARHFVLLGALTGFALGSFGALAWVRRERTTVIYCGKATGAQLAQAMLLYSQPEDDAWEPIAVPRYGIPTTDGEVTLQALPGREIKNEELAGVEWRGVNLQGVAFTECDLRNAHLEWADLRGAFFSECDLRGAFFSECDLRGARLDGANLTGVLYTSGTQWPAGFDPKAHGARLDE